MLRNLLIGAFVAAMCASALAGPNKDRPRSATARRVQCEANIAPMEASAPNLYHDMLAMCVQTFMHDAEPQEMAAYLQYLRGQ
ncbi:hypothetical protein WI87_23750 [Burkholderia ubonensis]|uniref:hypothetical protein n=1 Tax=Burkholderia ubonensis TaxID=101571 RepID=UPI0007573931|nr:hypothetical protein [Burkholderia ubonensis]KVD50576.1 hypothetical protein WI86_15760 [Burkholderia ubonensis]KVD54719.1 hypothetical protein WI87_23750 [Burkholderia ubonensis]